MLQGGEKMDELVKRVVSLIKSHEKKVMIGISGHGAAGKTTFSRKLVDALGEETVSYINTDPYIVSSKVRQYALIQYVYEELTYESKMTACHPSAHNSEILERDIQMLKGEKDFLTITTDYTIGEWLSSKMVTIVEGMSVAFINSNVFDYSFYFYTDEETELIRRYGRDIAERGADREHLKHSHRQRRMQYDLFMHPFSENFDCIIKSSNTAMAIEKWTK